MAKQSPAELKAQLKTESTNLKTLERELKDLQVSHDKSTISEQKQREKAAKDLEREHDKAARERQKNIDAKGKEVFKAQKAVEKTQAEIQRVG
jgi:Skp family chaperone for outer membrane proteins